MSNWAHVGQAELDFFPNEPVKKYAVLFIYLLFSLLLSSHLLSRGLVFWLSEAAEFIQGMGESNRSHHLPEEHIISSGHHQKEQCVQTCKKQKNHRWQVDLWISSLLCSLAETLLSSSAEGKRSCVLAQLPSLHSLAFQAVSWFRYPTPWAAKSFLCFTPLHSLPGPAWTAWQMDLLSRVTLGHQMAFPRRLNLQEDGHPSLPI